MTQLNFMVKLHPSSQLQIHRNNGRGVAFSLKLNHKSVFSSQMSILSILLIFLLVCFKGGIPAFALVPPLADGLSVFSEILKVINFL